MATESNCTELKIKYMDEPLDDFDQTMKDLSGIIYIWFVAFFAISLALMYLRKDLFPVCLKSPFLVAVETAGSICVATLCLFRDYQGRNEFSCIAYLVTYSLYVPLFCGAVTISLAQIYNRTKLAKAMTDFKITEERVDLDLLMKRVKRAGKMNELRLITIYLIPPTVVVVWALVTKPLFANNCRGCKPLNETFLLIFIFVLVLILGSLNILYRLKGEEDPMGSRKEITKLLKAHLCFALLWAIGHFGLKSKEWLNSSWILCLCSVYTHWVMCLKPVVKTYLDPKTAFKYRKRVVQTSSRRKRRGTSMVSPSPSSSVKTDSEELGLNTVLGTKIGLESFQKHLAQEFNVENILFWKAAVEWRKNYYDAPTEQSRNAVAMNIYTSFIPEHAKMQVNLQSSQRQRVEKVFEAKSEEETLNIQETVFDEAIEEIFNLMKRDGFQRYKATKEYKILCERILQEGVSIDEE